jgi:hypothetical protein
MSYSLVNLILALPRLIKRINKSENPHFVSKITSGLSSRGNFQVYITLNNENPLHYNFEITDKGEIYNSVSKSGVSACIVDWLLHIDQKRQVERVDKFKTELIENVWHPANFANFVNPDWDS